MNDTYELLLAALESFPNFVIIDAEGTVVHINESYAQLQGMTRNDAIGQPVDKVIPNTRLPFVLKSGKAEMGCIMTLYNHVTNKSITVVCNRIPIWKNGAIIGALGATLTEDLGEIGRLSNEIQVFQKEKEKMEEVLSHLKNDFDSTNRVVGQSPEIQRLKRMILEYADTNLSILITGETGVGKEMFARSIHLKSERAKNKYIKINCAAIPESLIESELFGYAPGAFTGALPKGKKGKFLMANKGTLLLDEISEMPLNLQAKLLRVLQEKEIEPIGSTDTIPVDVRIICSTNKDLKELVEKGKFRADLYYRINTVELHIPPLRERPEDILPLCEHFIDISNRENGFAISKLSEDALALLKAYSWPGNVRELEHIIQRASIHCKAGKIYAEHIDMPGSIDSETEEYTKKIAPLRTSKQNAEVRAIIQALGKTNGNKSQAAKLLGIDRSVLYSKINKYNIEI